LNGVVTSTEEADSAAFARIAEEALELARAAEQLAELDPGDRGLNDGVDPFAELDRRAMRIRSAVAAARRQTFMTLLYERGWTLRKIGKAWGITAQAVSHAVRMGGSSG
jgi:hypothetical protein